MQTLIKLDSKNKIRILKIWTDGPDLVQESGLLGGNLVSNIRTCTPKNVGRSNETTGADQAKLEMQSKINTKLDETYVLVPPTFSDGLENYGKEAIRNFISERVKKVPKAMLAKPFDERYINWEVGVFASPKLDGNRAMCPINEMWSRGGKPVETMDHIVKELSTRLSRDDRTRMLIPDGELYIHDKGAENFQDIVKAIKKYRPGVSELVEYWVYDIIDLSTPASYRIGLYQGLFENMKHVKVVPQYLCHSMDQVKKYHEQFLAQGYEGTMLKNPLSLYRENARSSDLLKYKDFQDSEFKIVDVVPMKNRPECGVMELEIFPGGPRFKATPKADYKTRMDMLNNKGFYIGKQGTVKYFSLTDDGIPRFPVFKAIRDGS
ncbi:MAG: hypothetical protein JSW41_04650 [Candidatus Aenigmatarchaeota archaeon]|nr:MAG: hypothetical protein JSW41_04650 [Candidatus Aenigmarchaeota archaeon]